MSADKNSKSTICAEHFEDACFSRKDKSRLKSNAVPTIQSNDTFNVDTSDATTVVTLASPAATVASASDAFALLTIETASSPSLPSLSTDAAAGILEHSNDSNFSDCKKCLLKDELLKMKDIQIKNLRKQLRKTQRQSWYLKRVKDKLYKLNEEFSKGGSIVNEELYKYIEV